MNRNIFSDMLSNASHGLIKIKGPFINNMSLTIIIVHMKMMQVVESLQVVDSKVPKNTKLTLQFYWENVL